MAMVAGTVVASLAPAGPVAAAAAAVAPILVVSGFCLIIPEHHTAQCSPQ